MVLVGLFFCVGDEENGHHACMNGHLTTAHQHQDTSWGCGKTAGVHGRHGVVEKKQSGFGNKHYIRILLYVG